VQANSDVTLMAKLPQGNMGGNMQWSRGIVSLLEFRVARKLAYDQIWSCGDSNKELLIARRIRGCGSERAAVDGGLPVDVLLAGRVGCAAW